MFVCICERHVECKQYEIELAHSIIVLIATVPNAFNLMIVFNGIAIYFTKYAHNIYFKWKSFIYWTFHSHTIINHRASYIRFISLSFPILFFILSLNFVCCHLLVICALGSRFVSSQSHIVIRLHIVLYMCWCVRVQF